MAPCFLPVEGGKRIRSQERRSKRKAMRAPAVRKEARRRAWYEFIARMRCPCTAERMRFRGNPIASARADGAIRDQAEERAWRMPWHRPATKDAASCENPRRGASSL